MLQKIGVFLFSLFIAISQIAYAHAPKQPDAIGQHDISALDHIGTLVCTVENIQVAVYRNIQERFAALVIFHNNRAVLASVGYEQKPENFILNHVDIWEQATPELILATPAVMETLIKMKACKEKMGLN